ncbi:hypothetical protein NIES4101_54000 [Calothrix sp. NIES-4101]|nr:hypothetical protein NIES4101_54000 [Calothrix sp. NIES-4101]
MKSGYIYLIHAQGTSRYKIGLTTRSVEERFAELNSSQSAYPLKLVASAKFPNVHDAEKNLHDKYRNNRAHGEWFEFSKQELREVVRSIEGGVRQEFSVRWFLAALAIALSLAYCQNQKDFNSPQPIKIQRQ